MHLTLYDTSTRAKRQFEPLDPTRVRMYVCGITPYDATHLGHAATYLTFDLVNRMWRDAGHQVHYVQNVTDVDDPLFERAAREGAFRIDRELAGRVEACARDIELVAPEVGDAFQFGRCDAAVTLEGLDHLGRPTEALRPALS